MKKKWSELPERIKLDIANNLIDSDMKNLADLSEKQVQYLNVLSPMELWDAYLTWNGFIGFATSLHIVHNHIFEEKP